MGAAVVEGRSKMNLRKELLEIFFESALDEESWHSKRAFTPDGETGKYYLNRNSGKSEYISDDGNVIERDTNGYDLEGNIVTDIPAGTVVKLLKLDSFAKKMPVYGPIESIVDTSMVPVALNGKTVYVAIAYIKKHKTKTQTRVSSGDSAQVSISAALKKKFPGMKILSIAKKGSNSGDIKFSFNDKQGEIEVKGTNKIGANITFFDRTYFFEEYKDYLTGNVNARTATIDELINAHASYKQNLPDKSLAKGPLNLIKVIESFRRKGNKEIGFKAQPGVKFESGIIPIGWFKQFADAEIYKKVLQSKMKGDNYFCLIDTVNKVGYIWFNEVAGEDILGIGNKFPTPTNCKLKTYRSQGADRLSIGFNCAVDIHTSSPIVIPLE